LKYLLTLFLTALFFALTYSGSPAEFLPADLLLIGVLIVLVTAFEYILTRLFSRHPLLEQTLLAGFITVNILYLNLILNEAFIFLPRYGQALALLVSVFIIKTLLDMMDHSRVTAKALPLLLAIATAGFMMAEVEPRASIVVDKSDQNVAENVRLVHFTHKPNVYFVGFDALIPKPLLTKSLGLETSSYHEVLGANFRRLKNFFADRVPTRQSLNSLLALDISYYDKTLENGTAANFFAGLNPSPLFDIFKHNGYETTTFFRSRYFGQLKGPYVDHYEYIDEGFNLVGGACEFIKPWGLRAFTFLGYCYFVKSKAYARLLSYFSVLLEIQDEADVLVTLMRDALDKDVPQLFVAYLFSPGHTDLQYNQKSRQDREEYREYFQESSKITAAYIKQLISFIQEEDPTAILFVFGDHGPFMSRGSKVEDDSTFFVQDRYGIYGGIFPKDRCEDTFSSHNNENFITLAQAARLIIRCLTDGTDALAAPEDYHLDISAPSVSKKYEDYLYE